MGGGDRVESGGGVYEKLLPIEEERHEKSYKELLEALTVNEELMTPRGPYCPSVACGVWHSSLQDPIVTQRPLIFDPDAGPITHS